MSTFRALTIQSGVYKQIQDANTLGVGGGIAAQTASQTLTITAGAGANIVAASLFDPSAGIDRSSATSLSIGATNATTVFIGRTGQTTQIQGDLSVQGTETVVGTTTFQNNATFEGNVTIGASLGPDTLDFASGFGFLASASNPDVYFLKEVNHIFAVANSTGSGTAGATLDIASGSATSGNAAGGNMSVAAGSGSGTGNGGNLTLNAGNPGSGVGGVGGTVLIYGGSGTTQQGGDTWVNGGSGTPQGGVFIGNDTTLKVEIGGPTNTTKFFGTVLFDTAARLGNSSFPDVQWTKEVNHTFKVAASTTSNTAGATLTVASGAAGAGNAAGGAMYVLAGNGFGTGNGGATTVAGGSSGAGATGDGGNLSLKGGTALSTNGNGGDVFLQGGPLSGSGTNGNVFIGTANTLLTTIGTSTNATRFDGEVDFVSASGRLGSQTNPDLYWTKELSHVFQVAASTTSNTVGGDLAVAAGDAGAGNALGGVLNLLGGGGVGSGNGGIAALISGAGGATGAGGEARVTGGSGGATSGAGGAVAIRGGAAPTNGAGGNVNINGGAGNQATDGSIYIGTTRAQSLNLGLTGVTRLVFSGANITVQANTTLDFNSVSAFLGSSTNPDVFWTKELNHEFSVDDSTTSNTAGGNLTVGAGNATSGNAQGGDLIIRSGNGVGTGLGGAMSITSGTGGATNNGGDITMTAGFGGATSGDGGSIAIAGGDAGGSGAGGDVSINGGLNNQNFDGTIYIGTTRAREVQLGNGSNRLIISGTSITVQASTTLTTTGSGNINLPNNGSARFKIESTSVGSTVTAPNLDTLTNGSNADALHTHSGVSASSVALTKTAGEALSAGNLLCVQDASGTPKAYQADANGAGQRPYPIGFTAAAVTSGNPATIVVAGEVAVADASWDAVPAVTDVGKIVYMSETVGNVTLTAPTGSGSVSQKVGIVSVGGTGAVKVLVQIGDGVTLA